MGMATKAKSSELAVSPSPINNSILVLKPYRSAGTWVFDDDAHGLVAEAFVCGMPAILGRVLAENGISRPESGFRLIFAAGPFPGHHAKLTWDREGECGFGNWYVSDRGERGWLCPALFHYFRVAPPLIYARVESLGG